MHQGLHTTASGAEEHTSGGCQRGLMAWMDDMTLFWEAWVALDKLKSVTCGNSVVAAETERQRGSLKGALEADHTASISKWC